jgi:hypothetical protein
MTLQNVAMIIAPNLFPLRKPVRSGETSEKTILAEMGQTQVSTLLCKLLIKYTDIIWTVPSFLVRQIRQQNEQLLMEGPAKDGKQGKKEKGKKTKVEIYRKINNEVDFQQGVIRVSAQFRVTITPIQLTSDMTAGNVVAQFINKGSDLYGKKNRAERKMNMYETDESPYSCSLREFSVAMDSHYLYEIGGNIEERRLEHGANLMAVYLENPNATWEIRCHHASVWEAR